MKLYITGSVASGKSTLARRLSQRTGVACFHLDDVVYEPDPDDPGDNRKRPAAQRDALFADILRREDYIIEDAGRACFAAGMEQADAVVLLEPGPLVRRRRALARWLRQRRGKEPCSYRPDFAMLRCMFRWCRDYEADRDGARERTRQLAKKLVVLKTRRDVERFLDEAGR